MRRILVSLFILFLICSNGAKSICAESVPDKEKAADDVVQIEVIDIVGQKWLLGTASSGFLQQYAVIKNAETQKKSLYKQGDWINNEFKIVKVLDDSLIFQVDDNKPITLLPKIPAKGLEFIETVELDTFEYWYCIPKEDREIKDKRFELAGIKDNKAVLERDYKEEPLQAMKKLSSFATATIKDTYEPSIDEVFFEQLKTKKMGPDVWIVDGKSVSESVLNNICEVVAETIKKVKVLGFGQDGIKLAFKSNSGEATLDKSGFLVDSLRSSVKEKAGLSNGDIIKSINGKKVTNVLDVLFLFLEIKNDNVANVRVSLLRNSELKTLTYVVN